jgi:hypothetical protein
LLDDHRTPASSLLGKDFSASLEITIYQVKIDCLRMV